MKTYNFSEARQRLSSILEEARAEGEVLIRRKDGSLFVIKPIRRKRSPLEVRGVSLDLSAAEIVDLVREVRER